MLIIDASTGTLTTDGVLSTALAECDRAGVEILIRLRNLMLLCPPDTIERAELERQLRQLCELLGAHDASRISVFGARARRIQ